MKRPLLANAELIQDGRNVDDRLGRVEGEGALQRVGRIDGAYPTLPEALAGADTRGTYYGRPLLKQPVWIWSIPVYFYAGGLGGAAGVLAAAAQLSGDPALRPLVRRLRWVSAASAVVSGPLLIHDLGRPERFLNMLRVFRPTSPMSMGSWLLAVKGATSAAGAVLAGARAPALRRAGDAAALASAAVDLPFAAYTAVLLANTAVPVWQSARRSLPLLFMASSAAGLASLLELMSLGARERRIVRRFGAGARVADALAGWAVERDAGAVPEVARPLHDGDSGRLWRAGKYLNAAALGLSLLPDRWRWARTAAGLLGTASALATRFAVVRAGHASAADPRATLKHQTTGSNEKGTANSTLPQDDRPTPSNA